MVEKLAAETKLVRKKLIECSKQYQNDFIEAAEPLTTVERDEAKAILDSYHAFVYEVDGDFKRIEDAVDTLQCRIQSQIRSESTPHGCLTQEASKYFEHLKIERAHLKH